MLGIPNNAVCLRNFRPPRQGDRNTSDPLALFCVCVGARQLFVHWRAISWDIQEMPQCRALKLLMRTGTNKIYYKWINFDYLKTGHHWRTRVWISQDDMIGRERHHFDLAPTDDATPKTQKCCAGAATPQFTISVQRWDVTACKNHSARRSWRKKTSIPKQGSQNTQ